jgi:hypothetical protein
MNLKIVKFDDDLFDIYWDKGTTKSKSAHPFYSRLIRRFDHVLLGENLVLDDSFILIDEARNVRALVPLYLRRSGEKYMYAGLHNGYQIAPLVFAQENTKLHQLVMKECFLQIENKAKERNVFCHKAYYNCTTVMSGTYFCNPLSSFGYLDESCSGLVLGLREEEKTIWNNLRKSYKPLINKALRNSDVFILDYSNYDFNICEEYRKLHFIVAGRETRPKDTFYAQYKLVENNQGYIVFVLENRAFVGAYFFYHLNNCAFYASAATRPECDDQSGIGHLGLWKGIEKAKKLGIHFFDFGMLEQETTDSKVKNIEFFKLGFGGSKVIVFRGSKTFQTN